MKWINDDRFYKNVKSATFYNDKGEVDNILLLDEYGSDVYSMNFERYDSNKNLIYEESDNSFDPMRYEPLNDQSGYLITNTSSKKYFLYDINNVLQETISFVCDNKVVEYAKMLKPSKRGELEITDLNNIYLREEKLTVELLGRGFAWLDTGTHHSLLQASQYVHTIEENQGIKIACLEEVAYRMGFMEKENLMEITQKYPNNEYFNYVKDVLNK